MNRRPTPRRRAAARLAAVPARTPAPSEADLIASLAGTSDKVSDEDLRQLFGSDLPELRELARERTRVRRSRGPRTKVYLLHGIMGAELGVSRLFWEDVIWLGLTDVLFGRLKKLTLGAGGDPRVRPLGFLPGVYLLMRLHLEKSGFEVESYAYDWRRNLDTLGAALKKRVEAEPEKVMIVAHSMGGLVTRSAFKQGMRNVARFIMLATPNHGSLAPVEALRGQYGLARVIAGGDLHHDAEALAKNVFGTFPGLYQMILARRLHPGLDLLDAAAWPSVGPRPKADLLALAGGVDSLLARPTDTPGIDWYLIAGVDQPTKVSAVVDRDEFVYTVSNAGDGTVPVESARIEDVKKTWFASAGHGFFANHRGVREATVEILETGDTAVLPTTLPAATRTVERVRESELRAVALTRSRARAGAELSHPERLRAIFGAPESMASVVVEAPQSAGGYLHRLEQVTIGRKKQRRLEVAFYNGSITDVNARAYVLGTFSGVTPTGAAAALDVLMDGAIAELIGSNMFGSRTGEVFMLPLSRREVRAEVGLFVGMGQYNDFKAVPSPASTGRGTETFVHRQHVPALEIAAENGARLLARTNVDDFATVLLGGTVAEDLAATGESMLRGFLRGLEDADAGEGVRRLVICETDPDRYRAMRGHLVYLATTPLCEGIEFVLSELDPPPEVRRLRALGVSTAPPRTGGPEPAYLLVSTGPESGRAAATARLWKFALLGPSGRAAVRESTVSVTKEKLDRLLAPLANAASLNPDQVSEMGRRIAGELLPAEIRADLADLSAMPWVVLHDAEASRIPWETLELSSTGERRVVRPALECGMSRRFLASTTACSRWSNGAVRAQEVNVLLVSNPTGDLPGAEAEAEAILKALASHPRFRVDPSLRGNAATREAVLAKLATGTFDIVHYSGHAYFDPKDRGTCGLLCAGEQVLTGRDIEGIARLPFLMVLNACQSAVQRSRPRGGAATGTGTAVPGQRTRSAPRTIAETMLCSGIANFIGTYWPVSDEGACKFALGFYAALLEDRPLGEAMLAGRAAIKRERDQTNEGDRANYILYGNRAARLKPD